MMSGSSTVTDAAFLRREVNIRKDGDKVILEVPEDSVPSLLSDTKLLAEAREASIETLWNASDMAAENYKEAVDAYAAGSGGFMPYASIGGFDLRHETGSYIDTAGLMRTSALASIKSLYIFAVQNREIEENPIHNIKIDKAKKSCRRS